MKKVVSLDAVFVPNTASLVFEGQIFDVYQWPQRMFDGSIDTFEMLKRPDTVSVIAITDDKVLVLDDEQPHTGVRQSLPGGRVDSDDASVRAAAQRELREETGYSFKQWRLLSVWQPHTKIEWFIHLWLTWDVTDQQSTQHDVGEKITVKTLSFEELKALVIDKSGYQGQTTEIFKKLKNMSDLMDLPEYIGQTVNR